MTDWLLTFGFGALVGAFIAAGAMVLARTADDGEDEE